jgi:NADH:ubiquinone oxidoreductase subunit 6 (subunit J)
MLLFNLLTSFVILVVSFFTILVSNPVHSVLLLILTFCLTAVYLFYVGAEFISLLYIIVYVGAVAVLFLFIVMMINVRLVNLSTNKQIYLLTFSFFLSLISLILFKTSLFSYYTPGVLVYFDYTWLSFFENLYIYTSFGDYLFLRTIDVSLGFVLFTFFGFSTLLAALLLFIALVGSIILVLPFHSITTKQRTLLQNSLTQINQDFRI